MGGNKTSFGKGKRIHNLKKKLPKVSNLKNWQLILILIPLAFFEATLLRIDHIKMTELRSAVISADENGSDEEVSSNLAALKEFVQTHTVINIIENNGKEEIMFGTGPFYLENQYKRKAAEALNAAQEAAGSMTDNPNGNVYAKAMAVCKPKAIAAGWAWNSDPYINCMLGEINKYPTSETLADSLAATIPPTSLYRHNYSSPLWTPTASGLILALCLVLLVVIIIRFIIWLVLRIAIIILQKH